MAVIINKEKYSAQLREISAELMGNIYPSEIARSLADGQELFSIRRYGSITEISARVGVQALQGIAAIYRIDATHIDALFPGGVLSAQEVYTHGPKQQTVVSSTIINFDPPLIANLTIYNLSQDDFRFESIFSERIGHNPAMVEAAQTVAQHPDFVIGVGAYVAHLANPVNQHPDI